MTTIRLAQPADYPAITQLLADALMVPALFAPPSQWWVATAPDTTVVGAVGVEPDGACWLLRSAVVAAPAQHNGIGKALVGTVTHAAQAARVTTLFCFGTDVGDYWERRGFSVVSVNELCSHVPNAPQIGQFRANGWLADEVAWRKNL
jgi:N-acetylglutamate synthase-like GNAT family acetyltransferase